MSAIQLQASITHADSGLTASSAISYEAAEAAFSSDVISVITVNEEVTLGDIVTPRSVFIKLISGDDLQVGFASGTYQQRLSGADDFLFIRLDVEGRKEISTIAAIADVSSAMSGKYFDLTDRTGTVRVWFNMAATPAFGTITYGSPANANTVTVNGTVFTKVASAPGANEFTDIDELNDLVTALNGISSTSDGSIISIVADTAGTAGNSITLAKTGSALTLSGATLTGGTDASADPTKATGTLTFVANPSNNDTCTIGIKIYTFKTTLTGAANEVLIGAAATNSIDNLISAITDGAGVGTGEGSLYGTGTTVNTEATASAGAGDTMTVTALTASYAGNLIATTETFTNAGNVFSVGTLLGGVRPIPVVIVEGASAITNAIAIAAALNADAQFVSPVPTTALVTVTDAHTGTRANIVVGTSGMVVSTPPLQQGAASPVVHLKSLGTSQVVVAVAPA